MAGKKLQITLPMDVYERLEEMTKKTSQKKSAVIITAINLMHTVKQQQPTKIEGQAVMM